MAGTQNQFAQAGQDFQPAIFLDQCRAPRSEFLLDKGLFTSEWLASRFTFLFVRNTWDWLRSLFDFYWKSKTRSRKNQHLVDFETFLHRCVESTGYDWPGPVRSQLNYFNVEPDFIGRFEYLDADWNRLLDTMGWEGDRMLPHRRFVRKNNDWRKRYTKITKRYVQENWAEEIERFGFEFE